MSGLFSYGKLVVVFFVVLIILLILLYLVAVPFIVVKYGLTMTKPEEEGEQEKSATLNTDSIEDDDFW